MRKRALIIWADGFEEIEAIAPVDILRRAGIEVVTAGLTSGAITGAKGVRVIPDYELESVGEQKFDAVILPGGLGGAEQLAASDMVTEILLRANREGWLIAGICASPALVLNKIGLLKGKKATCYPSFLDKLEESEAIKASVVLEDGLITSAGPGTALIFGLNIAASLVGRKIADKVAAAMLVEEY